MAAPDIVYRLARLDDYRAVLDIDKNFLDGWDYLGATYRHWYHAAGYNMAVAECNGVVVGFHTRYVHKDGDHYTLMSSRVRTDHQRLGILHGLYRFLGTLTRSSAQPQRYELHTATYGPFWQKELKSYLSGKDHLLRFMHFTMFEKNWDQLRTSLSRCAERGSDVVNLSFSRLDQLLDASDQILRVIDEEQSGLFAHGFCPLQLTTSKHNVKLAASLSLVSVTYADGGRSRVESLGFLNMMKCGGAVRAEIVNYAPNVEKFLDLIAHQLDHIINTTGRGTAFVFAVSRPSTTSYDQIRLKSELVSLLGENRLFENDAEQAILIRVPAEQSKL